MNNDWIKEFDEKFTNQYVPSYDLGTGHHFDVSVWAEVKQFIKTTITKRDEAWEERIEKLRPNKHDARTLAEQYLLMSDDPGEDVKILIDMILDKLKSTNTKSK